MSFFEGDFSNIPSEQAEIILPPTIQWWRGDRQSRHVVLCDGGFELPVDRYALEGVETLDFPHGGNAQPGYAFKGLHLAVLAHQKSWYDRETHRRVYGYSENRRVYSKLRLWALVKQIECREFLVSFSGMDSKAVEDFLNVFKKTVVKVASDGAGVQFPLYAFWLPVTAGQVVEWKQGGYSTPPRMVITPPVSEEKLKELYVGNEVIARAKAAWPVAREWADRMASQKGEVGEGQNGTQHVPPEPPPPPDDFYQEGPEPTEEIPF